MNANTAIKKLTAQECSLEFFSEFNRYQEITHCWRKENGEWLLKEIAFTEQWSEKKKATAIANLLCCINQGGLVIGALVNNVLIGFASMPNDLFGTNHEYIQLENLHVSFEFRGKGIGRALFNEMCDKAKKFGAKKLYISAHSSEETQVFYESMGCVEATEVNQTLYDEEPFDCHLEYCLYRTL